MHWRAKWHPRAVAHLEMALASTLSRHLSPLDGDTRDGVTFTVAQFHTRAGAGAERLLHERAPPPVRSSAGAAPLDVSFRIDLMRSQQPPARPARARSHATRPPPHARGSDPRACPPTLGPRRASGATLG